MAINLLETIKSKVGYSLAEHSADFFDEEQTNTGNVVNGTFAAILAGLVQKVSTEKGAKDLHRVLKDEKPRDYDIEDIFTRSPQTVNGLVNRGQHFLPTVYPGKLRAATNSVASDSGVKKLTSSKMMKIGSPLLLSILGKHVQDNNLNVNGLKSFLNGQKGHVESALPKGFIDDTELSAFGWVKKKVVEEVKPVVQKKPKPKKEKVVVQEEVVAPTPVVTQSASSPWWKWLIFLGLILVGLWLLLTKVMGCGAPDKIASTVAAPVEKVQEVIKAPVAEVKNIFGKVNDAAKSMLDKIQFTAGSAGDQMMKFIDGGAAGEGRFRFNNLNFASGSATIDSSSASEVDNIAAILKAYEDVSVRIEGHTDSQGNADSNLTLSQQRAEAVSNRLTELGIPVARVTTQGYGATNPVADNGTPEGRAENRRIEVVVIK